MQAEASPPQTPSSTHASYGGQGALSRFAETVDRNDLVYKVLPPRWVAGLPVGDGESGGMVWIEDQRRVIVTLDSVWAWDSRHVPVDVPPDNTYQRFVELMASGNGARVLAPGGPLRTKT